MSEKRYLNKRHEILFVYDVSMANPNGDPMDENKPRYDEETGRIFVTDVRIKRTIRDTLKEMGKEVFVIEERNENGTLKTKEEKVKSVGGREGVLERYIDIRLFGGTFALKKDKSGEKKEDQEEDGQENKKGKEKAWSVMGPVQFSYGQSLHRVKIIPVKGTTVMPSQEGKAQGTMWERYIVAYALIGVYGIANQMVAKDTYMTEEDLEDMLKALWMGHLGGSVLLSTSKLGHMPRLLIDIVHREGSLHRIGNLDRYLKLTTDKNDEEIRGSNDYVLNLEELVRRIEKFKDKIEKVRYLVDDELCIEPDIQRVFSNLQVEEISFGEDPKKGS